MTTGLTPSTVRRASGSGNPGFREDAGYWLVVAGVVLSCFAGHWSDLGVPVPLDRGLLLAGLAVEWNRARAMRSLPALTTTAVLVLAAAAWAALSFLAAPYRDAVGAFLLIDLFVLPAVLFISAPVLFGTSRRRFAFAAVFTVFAIYLGLTAITQTLQLSGLVLPAYILDPAVGIHGDRARGPYAEAVNNGIMLIVSGALAGLVAATAPGRRWRIAGRVGVLLAGVGCALTLTRAIWVAGVAVLVVAVAVVPGLRRRIPAVLAGIALLVAAFLVAFPDFGTAATSRGGDQSPIWDRVNVNAGSARMVLHDPLLGVGWAQAGIRMVGFVRLDERVPVTAASAGLIPHNVFLGRYAELGILGGTLWLVSVAAVIVVPVVHRHRAGFGAWRVVLLACTVCWLVVANFGPVNYSEPAYLIFLVGGVVAFGRLRQPAPLDWRPDAPHGAHRG